MEELINLLGEISSQMEQAERSILDNVFGYDPYPQESDIISMINDAFNCNYTTENIIERKERETTVYLQIDSGGSEPEEYDYLRLENIVIRHEEEAPAS